MYISLTACDFFSLVLPTILGIERHTNIVRALEALMDVAAIASRATSCSGFTIALKRRITHYYIENESRHSSDNINVIVTCMLFYTY